MKVILGVIIGSVLGFVLAYGTRNIATFHLINRSLFITTLAGAFIGFIVTVDK